LGDTWVAMAMATEVDMDCTLTQFSMVLELRAQSK